MKRILKACIIIIIFFQSATGQSFSISTDRNNVFYIGIDNPLTIAAENVSRKSLIIKADNGTISGTNGRYLFRGSQPGKVTITLYKKDKGKLLELGKSYFRAKNIPDPTFKIGSGKDTLRKQELFAQEYVRAELENFDIDINFSIESFMVCFISKDTCKYKELKNLGNKLNTEIREQFNMLNDGDLVVFKNILGKRPDESIFMLRPIVTLIKE